MEENKMTYEELEEKFNKVVTDNKQLVNMVLQLRDERGLQRFEYLFKVVENSLVFDSEFVTACAKEIKEALEVKQEEVVNE